jgi:hypothetical protein
MPMPNVEPDINDPNFYCKPYPAKYANLGVFRQHLRLVHKMIIEPLRKRRVGIRR